METWHRLLDCPSDEGNFTAMDNSPDTTSPKVLEETTLKVLGMLFQKGTYVAATSSQRRHTLPRRVQPRQAG